MYIMNLAGKYREISFKGLEDKLSRNNIVTLWVYRILVELEGHKRFLEDSDFASDAIATLLGLENYITGKKPYVYDKNVIKSLIFEQAKICECNHASYRIVDEDFVKNTENLASLLKLNQVELGILTFCIYSQLDITLHECLVFTKVKSAKDLARLLSVCLKQPIAQVEVALSPNGKLMQSGLMNVSYDRSYDFHDKIDLMADLGDVLSNQFTSIESIFKNIITPSQAPKLNKEHYPHFAKDISLISAYLSQAQEQKSRGVNVLIYGPPGSGKTEFVRMLATENKLELFEVATEGKNDKPLKGEERFNAFKLAQSLFNSKPNAVILFDEVEDVFKESGITSSRSSFSGTKCWVNKMLETNSTPAFWVTNDVESIDPAYIRRFDFVIEMKAPPRNVREKILNDYLEGIPVSEGLKNALSKNESLMPALVERSAKVIKTANIIHAESEAEKMLTRLLNSTMQAMQQGMLNTKDLMQVNQLYDINLLNTNMPLEHLCDGLKEFQQARVCLFGPPGTGKTAFGKYIADLLEMPLVSKKASDILSPYLGNSEKNMAKMFEEAREENAVLMLDEADTFLLDRKNAQRSWEISAVNEMLTQMESFDGIFIASTNFMDSLDSAAMRRFDIKLKFDYMNTAQVVTMFESVASRYNLETFESTKRKLSQMQYLTPGDFAVLNRKLKFVRTKNIETLLEMLDQECAFKQGINSNRIGF